MNKLKIYSEEQWFDTFYPKVWGDWKKRFNMGLARKNQGATGCSWMSYHLFGYPLSEGSDGQMKINKFESRAKETIDHFFIECGDLKHEKDVAYFLQPILQNKTKKYFANILIMPMESNLDLYYIYIAGNDDSSYTKHLLGLEETLKEIEYIKNNGVKNIQTRGYFFTN